jgi:uncharacterized protein DUF932
MYKGRTLPELAKELNRQKQTKKDFKAPTNLLEMSVQKPFLEKTQTIKPATLTIPKMNLRVGDKFNGEVSELCHDQLGKWTGIPSIYYDRLRKGTQSDMAMLAANVNHWLRNKEKETRLIRTLDDRARAFLSNRYRMIDNYDVANAVLPILMDESKKLGSIEVASCDVTDLKLYIKVTSKRLTYEVKKGDVVQIGIVISNSEVGKGSIRIEPFLLRLICDNGAAIEDQGIRKFHLGRQSEELESAERVFRDETRKQDDVAFMMKLADVVRASFDDENFEKLKGMTIDATTRKIKCPIQDIVEEVADRWSLSENHKASFLNNLIEGGDISQWGLANALTAVANKAENYEAATDLERIGGALMTLDESSWQQIAAA